MARLAYCEAPKPNSQPPDLGNVSVPSAFRHRMPDAFQVPSSLKPLRIMNIGLRNLDDLPRQRFIERVVFVAILDGKGMERALLSCHDTADHFRL